MADKKPLPSFYNEPQITHLAQLLEEIHSGQLLIPKFQRPFVWPRDKRLSLLESVLQGIPIGTIMVWRTHRRPGRGEPTARYIEIKRTLGPFQLPAAQEDSPVFQYVLDGEQRLMTLYFALYATPDTSLAAPGLGAERDELVVHYDLLADVERTEDGPDAAETPRFLFRSDIQGPIGSRYLPLTEIVSGTRLSKFQRELARDPANQGNETRLERMTEEADRVADAFRRYKVPAVPITTDDLPLLTKTFERINSNQTPMSEVHMVNALTWSEGFDLLDTLEEAKETYLADVGWAGLEDEIFLRVCKIEIGLPVYEVSVEKVSRRLREQPHVVQHVAERLRRVASFFRDSLGAYAPELVPYTIQIVLVAAAFLQEEAPGPAACSLLGSWVWFTTYAETFGRRLNESQIGKFLRVTRLLGEGQHLPIPNELPKRRRLERFDFRHARSRALALLLAERQATHMPDAPDVRELLASRKVEAVPRIVTAAMAGAAISKSPGARVLVSPDGLRRLRDALRGPHMPDQRLLDAHVIAPPDWQLFWEQRYDELVIEREKALNHLEEEHYHRVAETLFDPELL